MVIQENQSRGTNNESDTKRLQSERDSQSARKSITSLKADFRGNDSSNGPDKAAHKMDWQIDMSKDYWDLYLQAAQHLDGEI
jgi:hypothetical protein